MYSDKIKRPEYILRSRLRPHWHWRAPASSRGGTAYYYPHRLDPGSRWQIENPLPESWGNIPTFHRQKSIDNGDSHQTDQAPSSSEDLKLLLLSDSNLPVGGFVSSSGLESFINHGYLTHCKTDLSKSEAIINFTFSNAQNYANLSRSILLPSPYSDHPFPNTRSIPKSQRRRNTTDSNLNQLYDSMCLSPLCARRSLPITIHQSIQSFHCPHLDHVLDRLKTGLIEALKREIRRGNWSIHYPISFAFVTGLLEISLIMYTKMEWMLEKILQEIRGKRLGRTDLIDSGLLQPDEIIIDRGGWSE
ncbi:hypothetical protein PSTT_08461 [Puccinia striiformis]|uniref:Uncharacterized protein n=1 Tax=Puccinia striiformis TaxID=27350 RepID=A0A2S4VCE4_9BASI|nr:hypothetical protein PSTT_08461 [Puccinia striiformis]